MSQQTTFDARHAAIAANMDWSLPPWFAEKLREYEALIAAGVATDIHAWLASNENAWYHINAYHQSERTLIRRGCIAEVAPMTTTPREDAPLASPAMTAWCADFDDVALCLADMAQRHAQGDHSGCNAAINALCDYFCDLEIGHLGAMMVFASFAGIVALPEDAALAKARKFADNSAAYFVEKEGV